MFEFAAQNETVVLCFVSFVIRDSAYKSPR